MDNRLKYTTRNRNLKLVLLLFCALSFSEITLHAQIHQNWTSIFDIPQMDSIILSEDYVYQLKFEQNQLIAAGATFSIDTFIDPWHHSAPYSFILSPDGDSITFQDYHSCNFGSFFDFININQQLYFIGNKVHVPDSSLKLSTHLITTNELGEIQECFSYNDSTLFTYIQSILLLQDGNILLAGGELFDSTNQSMEINLVKIDPDGNLLWKKNMGHPTQWDKSIKILRSPQNTNYLVSLIYGEGTAHDYLGGDIEIRTLDPTGEEISRNWFGDDNQLDNVLDAQITPDGGIVFCGIVNGGNSFSGERGFIAKYDTAFNLLWSAKLEGAGAGSGTQFNEIVALEDSTYLVVGYQRFQKNSVLYLYDNDGTRIWDTIVDANPNHELFLHQICGNEEFIFVGGYHKDFTNFNPPANLYFSRFSGFAPVFNLEDHLCDFGPKANFNLYENGNTVVLFDQSETNGPYNPIISWEWNFGDGHIDTSRNPVHSYAIDTDQSIQLVVENILGCKDTLTRSRHWLNTTSALNYENHVLQIFPNPAQELVHIALPIDFPENLLAANLQIELFDLKGRLIKSFDLTNAQRSFQVQKTDLKSGVFVVQLKQAHSILDRQKLVVFK